MFLFFRILPSMKIGQKLWTREELILAINLYCKLPFGKLHRNNPDVQNLARLISRTDSSVAYKLVNFASLDPSLQARGIKGAANSSKLDREVWAEFYKHWDELAFESEQLLAEKQHASLEILHQIPERELPKEGLERERLVKVRVNQSFFRSTVLAAYNFSCCITGIKQPELLIAGHIRPWGLDEANRMNPRNGIAINALHDKAFEAGLITITPDYKVLVSQSLLQESSPTAVDYFHQYHGQEIKLPSRFLPEVTFLEYHNRERFKS
jgi:putative restriction endonuclease